MGSGDFSRRIQNRTHVGVESSRFVDKRYDFRCLNEDLSRSKYNSNDLYENTAKSNNKSTGPLISLSYATPSSSVYHLVYGKIFVIDEMNSEVIFVYDFFFNTRVLANILRSELETRSAWLTTLPQPVLHCITDPNNARASSHVFSLQNEIQRANDSTKKICLATSKEHDECNRTVINEEHSRRPGPFLAVAKRLNYLSSV